ncbi:MAG TPA: GH3 auxin-responsive promoter family protein [Anaeromyxobacter sp.]|nr:GH3 auxin-responsive promoter family protein [Anaeromyxobacter sp.]
MTEPRPRSRHRRAAPVSWGAACAGVAQLAVSLPAWRAFRAALDDPRGAQRAALRRILRGAAGTAFAREHGLEGEGADALRRAVPPRTYDELRPWIARAAAGERNVLTRAPVLRFQPSSGSAAPVKLLPWTAPLAAELRRAVAAWLADMALRRPALLAGPAYWSVSPSGTALPPTPGGVPVGFDDDGAYLGPVARLLARWALAVPESVRHLSDVGEWRRRTLLHLLRARELRLLSVWSPSFLSVLLGALGELLPGLAAEIAAGTPARQAGPGRLEALPPDPRRAAEVERAGDDPRRLWPRLALVSCWTDGPSAGEAARLPALLPGVEIAPKGLIATEGVVSIPFGGTRPLAVSSHFLEVDTGAGPPRLVHELREGDVGTVLLTTGGGLWRYRLEDRIEVAGFLRRTPVIRFLGKQDHVCDRVGEKVHAAFAAAVIARLRSELVLGDGYAFLAPDDRAGRPSYTLFLAAAGAPAGAPARLEALLRESFHYAHAAHLGQLAPARIFLVAGDAAEAVLLACAARGQRLGDVKPSPLRRERDWAAVLPGRYAVERA